MFQMKKIVSISAEKTRFLGEILGKELRGGETICLAGDLGAGKTTFAQGLLQGLGARGPYTSPTFVIMKEYRLKSQGQISPIQKVYHVDAYRIKAEDLLNLGWKEIATDKKNVTIVEWANRVKKIVPSKALWINLQWLDEKKRSLTFSTK